jgi:hypothetical protein
MRLHEHFEMLGTDADPPEEDLVSSALGVISYARQSLILKPKRPDRILGYMRSEFLRIYEKNAL